MKRHVTESTLELGRSYQFLNSLIENIPNMIFVKDAKELKFVRFNKAGEDLLGYSRQELIGKSDSDFFPKSEADFFIASDREVLLSGKMRDIPEEPILTRYKGIRILHTKKIPIYNDQGDPLYLLGISEDITEIKEAERARVKLIEEQSARLEAQKGIQLRDELISTASHELKNPLTALRLQLQFMPQVVNQFVDKSLRERYLSSIQRSLNQVDEFGILINNLLDSSRIQAGRLILNRSKVNLSELIHNVLDYFKVEIEKTGCSLNTNLNPEIWGLWDRARIEQAFINLLTNAMKYGKGKPIFISTTIEHGKAIIRVKDEGIGIAKEHHQKVFQRFERVAPEEFHGLGLGLFITKEIIDTHAGKIEIESELGKGCCFKIALPLD